MQKNRGSRKEEEDNNHQEGAGGNGGRRNEVQPLEWNQLILIIAMIPMLIIFIIPLLLALRIFPELSGIESLLYSLIRNPGSLFQDSGFWEDLVRLIRRGYSEATRTRHHKGRDGVHRQQPDSKWGSNSGNDDTVHRTVITEEDRGKQGFADVEGEEGEEERDVLIDNDRYHRSRGDHLEEEGAVHYNAGGNLRCRIWTEPFSVEIPSENDNDEFPRSTSYLRGHIRTERRDSRRIEGKGSHIDSSMDLDRVASPCTQERSPRSHYRQSPIGSPPTSHTNKDDEVHAIIFDDVDNTKRDSLGQQQIGESQSEKKATTRILEFKDGIQQGIQSDSAAVINGSATTEWKSRKQVSSFRSTTVTAAAGHSEEEAENWNASEQNLQWKHHVAGLTGCFVRIVFTVNKRKSPGNPANEQVDRKYRDKLKTVDFGVADKSDGELVCKKPVTLCEGEGVEKVEDVGNGDEEKTPEREHQQSNRTVNNPLTESSMSPNICNETGVELKEVTASFPVINVVPSCYDVQAQAAKEMAGGKGVALKNSAIRFGNAVASSSSNLAVVETDEASVQSGAVVNGSQKQTESGESADENSEIFLRHLSSVAPPNAEDEDSQVSLRYLPSAAPSVASTWAASSVGEMEKNLSNNEKGSFKLGKQPEQKRNVHAFRQTGVGSNRRVVAGTLEESYKKEAALVSELLPFISNPSLNSNGIDPRLGLPPTEKKHGKRTEVKDIEKTEASINCDQEEGKEEQLLHSKMVAKRSAQSLPVEEEGDLNVPSRVAREKEREGGGEEEHSNDNRMQPKNDVLAPKPDARERSATTINIEPRSMAKQCEERQHRSMRTTTTKINEVKAMQSGQETGQSLSTADATKARIASYETKIDALASEQASKTMNEEPEERSNEMKCNDGQTDASLQLPNIKHHETLHEKEQKVQQSKEDSRTIPLVALKADPKKVDEKNKDSEDRIVPPRKEPSLKPDTNKSFASMKNLEPHSNVNENSEESEIARSIKITEGSDAKKGSRMISPTNATKESTITTQPSQSESEKWKERIIDNRPTVENVEADIRQGDGRYDLIERKHEQQEQPLAPLTTDSSGIVNDEVLPKVALTTATTTAASPSTTLPTREKEQLQHDALEQQGNKPDVESIEDRIRRRIEGKRESNDDKKSQEENIVQQNADGQTEEIEDNRPIMKHVEADIKQVDDDVPPKVDLKTATATVMTNETTTAAATPSATLPTSEKIPLHNAYANIDEVEDNQTIVRNIEADISQGDGRDDLIERKHEQQEQPLAPLTTDSSGKVNDEVLPKVALTTATTTAASPSTTPPAREKEQLQHDALEQQGNKPDVESIEDRIRRRIEGKRGSNDDEKSQEENVVQQNADGQEEEIEDNRPIMKHVEAEIKPDSFTESTHEKNPSRSRIGQGSPAAEILQLRQGKGYNDYKSEDGLCKDGGIQCGGRNDKQKTVKEIIIEDEVVQPTRQVKTWSIDITSPSGTLKPHTQVMRPLDDIGDYGKSRKGMATGAGGREDGIEDKSEQHDASRSKKEGHASNVILAKTTTATTTRIASSLEDQQIEDGDETELRKEDRDASDMRSPAKAGRSKVNDPLAAAPATVTVDFKIEQKGSVSCENPDMTMSKVTNKASDDAVRLVNDKEEVVSGGEAAMLTKSNAKAELSTDDNTPKLLPTPDDDDLQELKEQGSFDMMSSAAVEAAKKEEEEPSFHRSTQHTSLSTNAILEGVVHAPSSPTDSGYSDDRTFPKPKVAVDFAEAETASMMVTGAKDRKEELGGHQSHKRTSPFAVAREKTDIVKEGLGNKMSADEGDNTNTTPAGDNAAHDVASRASSPANGPRTIRKPRRWSIDVRSRTPEREIQRKLLERSSSISKTKKMMVISSDNTKSRKEINRNQGEQTAEVEHRHQPPSKKASASSTLSETFNGVIKVSDDVAEGKSKDNKDPLSDGGGGGGGGGEETFGIQEDNKGDRSVASMSATVGSAQTHNTIGSYDNESHSSEQDEHPQQENTANLHCPTDSYESNGYRANQSRPPRLEQYQEQQQQQKQQQQQPLTTSPNAVVRQQPETKGEERKEKITVEHDETAMLVEALRPLATKEVLLASARSALFGRKIDLEREMRERKDIEEKQAKLMDSLASDFEKLKNDSETLEYKAKELDAIKIELERNIEDQQQQQRDAASPPSAADEEEKRRILELQEALQREQLKQEREGAEIAHRAQLHCEREAQLERDRTSLEEEKCRIEQERKQAEESARQHALESEKLEREKERLLMSHLLGKLQIQASQRAPRELKNKRLTSENAPDMTNVVTQNSAESFKSLEGEKPELAEQQEKLAGTRDSARESARKAELMEKYHQLLEEEKARIWREKVEAMREVENERERLHKERLALVDEMAARTADGLWLNAVMNAKFSQSEEDLLALDGEDDEEKHAAGDSKDQGGKQASLQQPKLAVKSRNRKKKKKKKKKITASATKNRMLEIHININSENKSTPSEPESPRNGLKKKAASPSTRHLMSPRRKARSTGATKSRKNISSKKRQTLEDESRFRNTIKPTPSNSFASPKSGGIEKEQKRQKGNMLDRQSNNTVEITSPPNKRRVPATINSTSQPPSTPRDPSVMLMPQNIVRISSMTASFGEEEQVITHMSNREPETMNEAVVGLNGEGICMPRTATIHSTMSTETMKLPFIEEREDSQQPSKEAGLERPMLGISESASNSKTVPSHHHRRHSSRIKTTSSGVVAKRSRSNSPSKGEEGEWQLPKATPTARENKGMHRRKSSKVTLTSPKGVVTRSYGVAPKSMRDQLKTFSPEKTARQIFPVTPPPRGSKMKTVALTDPPKKFSHRRPLPLSSSWASEEKMPKSRRRSKRLPKGVRRRKGSFVINLNDEDVQFRNRPTTKPQRGGEGGRTVQHRRRQSGSINFTASKSNFLNDVESETRSRTNSYTLNLLPPGEKKDSPSMAFPRLRSALSVDASMEKVARNIKWSPGAITKLWGKNNSNEASPSCRKSVPYLFTPNPLEDESEGSEDANSVASGMPSKQKLKALGDTTFTFDSGSVASGRSRLKSF
eukprot:jgi/Bigna1/67968/fgenesh1_pg.5_\